LNLQPTGCEGGQLSSHCRCLAACLSVWSTVAMHLRHPGLHRLIMWSSVAWCIGCVIPPNIYGAEPDLSLKRWHELSQSEELGALLRKGTCALCHQVLPGVQKATHSLSRPLCGPLCGPHSRVLCTPAWTV